MADTTILGLADLERALSELPAKVESNIARGAVRAGAKVIWQAAKANVPKDTGLLAASIKFGARIDKRIGAVVGTVRAGAKSQRKNKGKRKPGPQAYYAHFVEFGTAAHLIKAPPNAALNVKGALYASVLHPGARKQPFMRPAVDSQATAAAMAVAEYMRKALATKHGIDVPAPKDPQAVE